MAYKILIAEDEMALGHALELKLEKSGYEVTLVNDGQAALEALKKSKFSVLLLDIIMPKKNGFEVLEEMKKVKNKTPVIILSNLGQEEDVKKAHTLGAKDYFIKADVPLQEVVKLVAKYVKK